MTKRAFKLNIPKVTVFSFFLLVFHGLYAQEGNIWHFGKNAGLDFNTTPPTPITGSINTAEGCAAISDKNGNLLFSTDGSNVYDKLGSVMPNGSGLLGNPSSTQAAVIVPKPGSYVSSQSRPSSFYVFTVDYNFGTNGIRYSEINMNLNGGLGDVLIVNKNTHIIDTTTTEKIAIAKHANDCDYWVICKPVNTNDFHSYLVSSTGVSPSPVISSPGPNIPASLGYISVSPDNSMISLVSTNPKVLYVYDFDDNTGMLSTKFFENDPTGNRPYGVEFSPNSRYIYITGFNTPINNNIYQYDLTTSNNAAFIASKTIAGTTTNSGSANRTLGALKLGPDNKIYVALPDTSRLGVINNPNNPGLTCNYVDYQQALTNKSVLGLTTFPNFHVVPKPNIEDSVYSGSNHCVNDTILFYLDDTSQVYDYEWFISNTSFPSVIIASDTTPTISHAFQSGEDYLIKAIIQRKCYTDTIIDTVSINNPSPILITSSPNDTVCFGSQITLTATNSSNYTWNNGVSNGMPFNVFSTNTYTVIGVDTNGCSDTNFIAVSVIPQPLTAEAGADEKTCKKTFTLAANQPTNPGESGIWTSNSNATINTPNDPNTIVSGLSLGENTFIWTIKNEWCPPNTDTVIINVENCEPDLIIPNVFTPNGDEMNDRFTIGTTNISFLSCDIYNRWGQKIYTWNGINGFWDGRTTSGTEIPDGTYFYIIQAKGLNGEEYFRKGVFSLIR